MPRREAKAVDMDQHEKPGFPLEDLESGKITINSAWLKEIWSKWPGDESIEELLASRLKDQALTGKVDL